MKNSLLSLLFILSAGVVFAGYGLGNKGKNGVCTAGTGNATNTQAGVCAKGSGSGGGNGAQTGVCSILPTSTDPLTLSDAAVAALKFQIDEERMAGEIYGILGELWELTPFENIERAEAWHQAALLQLAARADVSLPTEIEEGVFATSEIQARYDALVDLGRSSAEAALKVGAFIEEQDIVDLKLLMDTIDDADVQLVAATLKDGSCNHLRAFVRALKAMDIDYEPQVLSEEEFTEIIDSATTGGKGKGLRGGGC